MSTRQTLSFVTINVMLIISVGCSSQQNHKITATSHAQPVTMLAMYTNMPVAVDGKLDEEIWKKAQSYKMHLSSDKEANGQSVLEGGEVRFAWDDNYFYLGASFVDSDVVAEGKADQLHHYLLGDVCELFLKPENSTWYWELYATPTGRKTSFWFPGRGRLGLPSCFEYKCDLKVAAKCDGTINDWSDKDTGWTAEMAMPIKALTENGDKFDVGANWRILIGRYNYSRYLERSVLSMSPMLSKTDFHLLEDFGTLRLVK